MAALGILTDATCGSMCWYAKEEICRCSCGGVNHGVLLDDNAESPERIVKIDGFRYKLIGVDQWGKIRTETNRILLSYGWARISANITYANGKQYHYAWNDTEKGSPVRVKLASQKQFDTWPEIEAYKNIANENKTSARPYLMWLRVDKVDPLFCDKDDKCERCEDRKLEIWYNTL